MQQAYGHLNNVIYVRYAETSRIAFINQVLGPRIPAELYDSMIRGTGLGPILKSISMSYKAPVVFPDVILMASRVPAGAFL
jgi:acyl-CoA thioesterase FadM